MADRTFKTRAVVLRKTKLKEKDLIVTLLDESGALVKAVAKGARKPGGSLAAKMELFSVVEGLFATGKSLAIATDVRFSQDYAHHVFGMEQAACASPVAELLSVVAQEGLAHERLFELTVTAFDVMGQSMPEEALRVCPAALLKILSMTGFRPSLDHCTHCGIALGEMDGALHMSLSDGGVVCGACERPSDAYQVDRLLLEWCIAVLRMRFTEIALCEMDASMAFSILQFVKMWTRVHVGVNLKSLDFLFSSGLY